MKFLSLMLLYALTGILWTARAGDTDLTGYRPIELKEQITRIPNPDFEADGQGWTLQPGCAIEANGGRNGTRALRYERPQPQDYQLVTQRVPLTPDRSYRFGAWIKTENVRGGRGGATIAMEFMKNNEAGEKVFRSGLYPRGVSGTADWTWVADVVRVPRDAVDAHVTLYLHRDETGTAWFDDISVQELDGNLWTVHLTAPFGRVTSRTMTVRISHDGHDLPPGDWALQLNVPKTGFASRQSAAETITFTLPEWPAGSYEAELLILDRGQKQIAFATRIPFTLPTPENNQVVLDEHGRLRVDGELFMPIGIFGSSLQPEMLDLLKASGFNCTLPYGSMSLKGSTEPLPPLEQIARALDGAAAKGIKVIFSLKDIGSSQSGGFDLWHGIKGAEAITTAVVSRLKDHPAILAWYTADEASPSQASRLTAMRRLCNTLDQAHPVYGVFYQYEQLPTYAPAFDVIGIDPYPLSGNTLQMAVYAMDQARRTGLPIWSVPQVFNWGVFKPAERNNPNPSEEKMRSLILLEAALGAKGFILYSYQDLRPPRSAAGNFETEWPKVRNLVAMLKKLEPFIMSGQPAEILLKGPVVAAELRNSAGKRAVIICSVGPGKATASLRLDGDFQPAYGRTGREGDLWLFAGEDISSDILFEK